MDYDDLSQRLNKSLQYASILDRKPAASEPPAPASGTTGAELSTSTVINPWLPDLSTLQLVTERLLHVNGHMYTGLRIGQQNQHYKTCAAVTALQPVLAAAIRVGEEAVRARRVAVGLAAGCDDGGWTLTPDLDFALRYHLASKLASESASAGRSADSTGTAPASSDAVFGWKRQTQALLAPIDGLLPDDLRHSLAAYDLPELMTIAAASVIFDQPYRLEAPLIVSYSARPEERGSSQMVLCGPQPAVGDLVQCLGVRLVEPAVGAGAGAGSRALKSTGLCLPVVSRPSVSQTQQLADVERRATVADVPLDGLSQAEKLVIAFSRVP